MNQAIQPRRPCQWWSALALVLLALALVQGCGKSGSGTGPSSNSALQLKLRQTSGAQVPCGGGTYVITAPGYPPLTGSFGQDGQINVQLTVGVTYTITVTACGLTGSTVITVPPGGATGEIVITVSKVLGLSCSPSTIAPGGTSTCTCNVQSPGPANITWTGVNASGPTASFSSNTPGTYPITCTINGVDTRSTTVTVKEPEPPPVPPVTPTQPTTGTIVIENDNDEVRLRATFSGGVPELIVNPLASGSRTVAPGTYDVTIEFEFDGFLFCTSDMITVASNETQTRSYSGNCLAQRRR
jgi:hypothetical protein